MKITINERTHTVTMLDCELEGKNFSGSTGLWWDKFNDGTKRKVAIKLTEEEANWFAQQGAKVRVMEANEKYPEPKYFIEVLLGYKGKKPPQPGQPWNTFENGPRVVMVVPGGKNTDLTEETVGNLDRAYIVQFDMELRMAPAKLRDGSRVMRGDIPGVTLYAERIFATVERNELEARYEGLTMEQSIADQEDYEEYLRLKNAEAPF